MNKQELLKEIRTYYIKSRIATIDIDFLEFEETMCLEKDLEKIVSILNKSKKSHEFLLGNKLPNNYNSIILYVSGISDEFNFEKGRALHRLGTSADIDLDFQPSRRDEIKQYIVDTYGKESVAQIGAIGTFGIKGMVKDLGRINEPLEPKKGMFEDDVAYEIAEENYNKQLKIIRSKTNKLSDLIPEPVHGKAPTLEKTLAYNLKQKEPIDLRTSYPDYYNFASYAEDMRKQMGVHAAGIVISNERIDKYVPTWKNKDYDIITQFDKDEIEALGLIKFDLLVIDSLDVIAESLRLIKNDYNINIDIYKISEDPNDKKAFKLLNDGILTGIFQFEGGGLARKLVLEGSPQTLEDISALSSLNRPGPVSSGLVDLYLNNKESIIPDNMPSVLINILSSSRYCMIYQEQIMQAMKEMAGFTLKESDDIRRALGKKKAEILEPYKNQFIEGCIKLHTCSKEYAQNFWSDLEKYADYVFNLGHSCSYSLVTYTCLYLKANYPLQFLTAFLTIKSSELAPEDFQLKLKEVTQECKLFGFELVAPDINKSYNYFVCNKDTFKIYYGLSGIKSLAGSANEEIVKSRPKDGYKDIFDFLINVNKARVNQGKFEVLVHAGCFDKLGYQRKDLLDNKEALYKFFSDSRAYNEREKEIIKRNIEREEIEKNGGKKKPILKPFEQPVKPEIQRYEHIKISLTELNTQAEYIGTYLGAHPVDAIKGDFTNINKLWIGKIHEIKGIITSIKEITTKTGTKMAFLKLEDKSGSCDLTVFTNVWIKVRDKISTGKIIKAMVKVESEKPLKAILNSLEIIN